MINLMINYFFMIILLIVLLIILYVMIIYLFFVIFVLLVNCLGFFIIVKLFCDRVRGFIMGLLLRGRLIVWYCFMRLCFMH